MARWDYDAMLALAADTYPATVRLSDESLALLLSITAAADKRGQWEQAGNPLNNAQWDVIDNLVATAQAELMRPTIGWILPTALATLPDNWLECDGTIYDAVDYPELFAVLDPAFKISGTQFRTPDLMDRTIVGAGISFAVNAEGGEPEVTLETPQMPTHNHTTVPHSHTYSGVVLSVETIGADVIPIPSVTGSILVTSAETVTVNTAGSSEAHNNMQPYRALRYAIVAR